MKISDLLLIENLNRNVKKGNLSFFHPDTTKNLELINDQMKGLNGGQQERNFTEKEIASKIVVLWGCLLQDSISALKRHDFREHSHWQEQIYSGTRDINDVAFGIERVCKYFASLLNLRRCFTE